MVLLSNSRRGVFLSEGGVWREHNTRAFAETMQLMALTYLPESVYNAFCKSQFLHKSINLSFYYY